MTLQAGYSKVRLSNVDAILNVANEIVGFINPDGSVAKIPSVATDPITGAVTGLVGPGGFSMSPARTWFTQPSSYAANPRSDGTFGDISSSADRIAHFAGHGYPIVISGVSRFGGNIQWGTTSTPDADYPGSAIDTVYSSTPSALQSSASAWLKYRDNADGTQEYGMGRIVKYPTGALRFTQYADDALVASCPRIQWFSSGLLNLRRYRFTFDIQFGDATTPFPAYVANKDPVLFFQLKGAATQPVISGVAMYDSPTSDTLTVQFNVKRTNGGAITTIAQVTGVAKATRVTFTVEGLLTFNSDGWWDVKHNGVSIGGMTGNTLMSDLPDSVQCMLGIYRYSHTTKAPDDCSITFHNAGIEILG